MIIEKHQIPYLEQVVQATYYYPDDETKRFCGNLYLMTNENTFSHAKDEQSITLAVIIDISHVHLEAMIFACIDDIILNPDTTNEIVVYCANEQIYEIAKHHHFPLKYVLMDD